MAKTFGFAPAQDATPDPVQLLFLFGAATGDEGTPTLISLLFLLALPLALRAYMERRGEGPAGVVAALLFFASPIVGHFGTIAAPEIILAAAAFALFYTWQLRLRAASILLAVFLVWSLFPWLQDVFTPFAWHWSAGLPLQLTIMGPPPGQPVQGILGVAFLLAPIALFNLRDSLGRRLLAVALLVCLPALWSTDSRAFIVGLPFLSLALARVLCGWRMCAPAAVAAQAVFGSPWVLRLYVLRF